MGVFSFQFSVFGFQFADGEAVLAAVVRLCQVGRREGVWLCRGKR
jgi:hypothetical protein